MFKLDDSLEKVDLPADRVLKLFRSMRDVQLALPGQPSQEASAYVCQYRTDKAVATLAAFYLERSRKLTFYHSEPREVAAQKASAILERGLDFVESMGFLLTDMDIDLMADADREMLWTSLPLYKGSAGQTGESPTPEKQSNSVSDNALPAFTEDEKSTLASEEARAAGEQEQPDLDTPEAQRQNESNTPDGDEQAVDELLAAVENLCAGRAGLNRSIRKQASPEEITQRSLRLKENLGRILASL